MWFSLVAESPAAVGPQPLSDQPHNVQDAVDELEDVLTRSSPYASRLSAPNTLANSLYEAERGDMSATAGGREVGRELGQLRRRVGLMPSIKEFGRMTLTSAAETVAWEVGQLIGGGAITQTFIFPSSPPPCGETCPSRYSGLSITGLLPVTAGEALEASFPAVTAPEDGYVVVWSGKVGALTLKDQRNLSTEVYDNCIGKPPLPANPDAYWSLPALPDGASWTRVSMSGLRGPFWVNDYSCQYRSAEVASSRSCRPTSARQGRAARSTPEAPSQRRRRHRRVTFTHACSRSSSVWDTTVSSAGSTRTRVASPTTPQDS